MSLMLFTHYLFGYVGTALCSIGILLALCSVYIFTRRQMRSPVSTYLASLSISDSCLLLMGLFIGINASIHPNRQSESYYSSRLYKYLFPYVYACTIWFQFTSVWITVGFAIDRWSAIKWPMSHYTHTSKRACYIVLTIYCFGFVYSLPRFFEYKTEVQHEGETIIENQTEYIYYVVITNQVLKNPIYHYVVQLFLYSIFQSILPLLLLSYFNVELIRSINASSKFLKDCTSLYIRNSHIKHEANVGRHREGSITRSVICLIALFILCQVPASILHYLYMFYRNHDVLYICYDISNFLIFLNSAVNFFIFTYFNRRFRLELARVCFYTKKTRDFIFRTPSHLSMRLTNSSIRFKPQNSHPTLMTRGNSWESQQRPRRQLSQADNESKCEIINAQSKRSSEISIASQHSQRPYSQHSRSSSTLRLLHRNSSRIHRHERFCVYETSGGRSKRSSYQIDQGNHQKKVKHYRRYSEQVTYNRTKHTITNYHDRHVHYVTFKRIETKPKDTVTLNLAKGSSTEIT